MDLPPLITTDGLVLDTMVPNGQSAQGRNPPNTATAASMSVLLRGMLRAAIATGDDSKKDYCTFLFSAACRFFFNGVLPTSNPNQLWKYNWAVNGGVVVNTQGPMTSNGDPNQYGYVQSVVSFTNGVGMLNPAPSVCYGVFSQDAKLKTQSVLSTVLSGTTYTVDYYINAQGAKVIGSQRDTDYGQPTVPAGQHSDGAPGKVVLKESITSVLGVNYTVPVPQVNLGYGDAFDTHPMWRRLASGEISSKTEAMSSFLDAFALGMELEPSNPIWEAAYTRMKAMWDVVTLRETGDNLIFKAGASGTYNNFPYTFSYAYGRDNVDDPLSVWRANPDSDRYSVARTGDGYVTFSANAENYVPGTGLPLRNGIVFENNSLFLNYTLDSKLSLRSYSSVPQPLILHLVTDAGTEYTAPVLLPSVPNTQTVQIKQFQKFQQEPGDATGIQSGNW